jgi:hypothetical protein
MYLVTIETYKNKFDEDYNDIEDKNTSEKTRDLKLSNLQDLNKLLLNDYDLDLNKFEIIAANKETIVYGFERNEDVNGNGINYFTSPLFVSNYYITVRVA